jgi:hypothetical protein
MTVRFDQPDIGKKRGFRETVSLSEPLAVIAASAWLQKFFDAQRKPDWNF